MKTKFYVYLSFCLGVLVTLWLQMPATWLAHGIKLMTQERVQILNARGTVWRGSGVLLFTGGKGSDSAKTLPERVNWQLSFNWFSAKNKNFSPNLAMQLEQSCCLAQPLNLVIEPGINQHNIYINNFTWRVPANVLAGFGAPWNTLNLQGTIALRSQPWQVLLSNNKVQADGQLDVLLQDMSSALSTVRPLGSYQISIEPKPTERNLPEVEFNLHTNKGAFQMSGHGVGRQGVVTFKGQAYAKPGYEDGLANLLTMIQSSQGAIQFQILRGDDIPSSEDN